MSTDQATGQDPTGEDPTSTVLTGLGEIGALIDSLQAAPLLSPHTPTPPERGEHDAQVRTQRRGRHGCERTRRTDVGAFGAWPAVASGRS
jgi:hypothetical protein